MAQLVGQSRRAIVLFRVLLVLVAATAGQVPLSSTASKFNLFSRRTNAGKLQGQLEPDSERVHAPVAQAHTSAPLHHHTIPHQTYYPTPDFQAPQPHPNPHLGPYAPPPPPPPPYHTVNHGLYQQLVPAPPIDPRFEKDLRLIHLNVLKEIAKNSPADLSSNDAKQALIAVTVDELYKAHTMRVPYLFNMKFIMLYDKAIARPCSQLSPKSIVYRKHIEELRKYYHYNDRVETMVPRIADVCKIISSNKFRHEVKEKLEPMIKMSVDKPRSCFGWLA